MKVVLTGGGTGGHIYPCLAVAEVLKEQGVELFYIANKNKLEAELLQREQYAYIKFLSIEAPPLPKISKIANPVRVIFELFKFMILFIISTRQSIQYLSKNKIDRVFGTGGYVAAPVFAAAIILKIPYVIHNLDAYLGLANRVFVKDASALSLAFPLSTDSHSLLKPRSGKVVITGNPVSKKFYEIGLAAKPSAVSEEVVQMRKPYLNILVTGGSQGAETINEAIGMLLPNLFSIKSPSPRASVTTQTQSSGILPIRMIHITGAKLYDEFVNKYLNGDPNKYTNYEVYPYTHEMYKLCHQADIAICRSGAMTIAEMVASQVVPIFVPLPWAANDHQTKNAQALVNANAAFMLRQDNVSQEEFCDALLKLIYKLADDEKLLKDMRANLAKFANPNVARDIADLICL